MAESRLIFIFGILVIFFGISVNSQDDFLYFKKAQPITQQTTEYPYFKTRATTESLIYDHDDVYEIPDDQPQAAISLGLQESRKNCLDGYAPFKRKAGTITCVRSRRP